MSTRVEETKQGKNRRLHESESCISPKRRKLSSNEANKKNDGCQTHYNYACERTNIAGNNNNDINTVPTNMGSGIDIHHETHSISLMIFFVS